ncbi:MAG: response regulator [Verrucomicrobia bacterium]|nr:response regulator [Verrucomicrobiota bacterium]MDE3099270.1 response regulator [Verrucomicrobiota bacterium]
MKRILIIEDNQVCANVYRNKLAVEGYQTEVALDGETGVEFLHAFRPHFLLLDLLLPGMSGLEVIKAVREDPEFSKLPIVVFSNTYLTHLVQDAWKAGATKCLSKASCTPKDVFEIVQATIGESGTGFRSKPTAERPRADSLVVEGPQDAAFQSDLRKTFVDDLPAMLVTLRATVQSLVSASDQAAQLKDIYELYRRLHALAGNAGIVGLNLISKMADATEALLRELHEKPETINLSCIRTVASAVDLLGTLFERGLAPGKQEMPPTEVLVVDDEPISRRAIVYSLEKARLKSVTAEDAGGALKWIEEKTFDLIFLDIDLPGMDGHDLCSRIRQLPQYKRTPIIFVTALSDFDNRAHSMMAGGNDFVAKPFLFIELTVKALIHILRAHFAVGK